MFDLFVPRKTRRMGLGRGKTKSGRDVGFRCGNEAAKEWMSPVGTALQLRVELAGEEPGVIRQFDQLHKPSVRRKARENQSGAGQQFPIDVVEFIPVAMALVDLSRTVDLSSTTLLQQTAGVAT